MNLLMKRTFLLIAGTVISFGLFAQKEDVPHGWHLMDQGNSGFYGISIDKAYDFVKSSKVRPLSLR